MRVSLEDKSIAVNIRKGDVFVFEAFFKKNYKNLCYYAEDILREKESAEEIVSEVFMKLWEKRETLEIQDSLKAYLYASVRNNCIKHLEHMKVLHKYKDYATYTLQNIDLLHPASFYPLSDLITKESMKDIDDAIASLPDQCREVFQLSRFDELTYDEIAFKLNISINTVRTQMSRALQKLRERLKAYLPVILIGMVQTLFTFWQK